MASGTLGADDSREKQRWGDGNKVYTRKIHNKGLKNNNTNTNNSSTAAAPTSNAITTVTAPDDAPNKNNNDNDDNNANNTTTSNNNNNANNTTTNNNVPQQSSQTLATEEANSSQQQQQTVSRLDAPSDDSSNHNPTSQVAAVNGCEPPNRNGVIKAVVTKVDNRVRINLAAAGSKDEIRELRRKLVSELDQVRSLKKKLEAKEVQLTVNSASAAAAAAGGGGGYSQSQYSANDVMNRGGLVRVNSEVGSVGLHNSRPFRQLSVPVMENNNGVGEFVEKEKRTPKANQYYRNSEFLLGKERLPPAESNKKLKSNGGKKHGGEMGYRFGMDKYMNQAFKSCSNLLGKLMKHKHAWVFNKPVDAKSLGLHDYHDIIKNPMDMGTVKSKLAKNWYKSPRAFAEDVRLIFRNAMTYNPKGQDVHIMAEQMSEFFEEKWAVIEAEYNLDWRYEMVHGVGLSTPIFGKAPLPFPSAPEIRSLDRSDSMTVSVDSRPKTSNIASVGRTPVPKKPKAKDPNKRDMTYEEKQRLSTNLQSLPSEKLDNIVEIIKKSNSAVCQHDDEIEVDIDSVDTETLWELDRFVTNYKKRLSKNKRKAELALQARAAASQAFPAVNPASAHVEAPKETRTDEKNATSPVQGERQGDNASRSSSSSSSSSDSGSSSSDSDSDSSSGYGSDAGHSPRT
ncbi:transcription factor GTE4-like [Cornus florida]|uniref:transcription factor GTE4-like n=1 Tax=Cornus florida TaxID=4283 RepID=UPI00289DC2DC|nr:transcription factor GTE4-like [Cornus florida]XP_059661450.1 transcription factor GTE4-like [Cornus florida]XP_059661452.1 transcription factor GTE4-like [Cornus florida]